jgi:hypothetical protein
MAKMIGWNTEAFQKECVNVSMDRLEAAARIIRDDAKRILQSQIKGPPVTRHEQKKPWMERDPGALVATIRIVRKKGDPNRNIWIMAGNYKTWWALQTEYGRGGWKGGKKSFMRPAMVGAPSAIKFCLEEGHGETK